MPTERKGGREAVQELARRMVEQSQSGRIEVHDPVRNETTVITGRAGALTFDKALDIARKTAREGDARHEEARSRGRLREQPPVRMEGTPVAMPGRPVAGYSGADQRARLRQPKSDEERAMRDINRKVNPEFAEAVERARRG